MKSGLTKREHQVTDRDEVLEILDKCKVLHLGLTDGMEPYIVPMSYGYRLDGEDLTLYLHGATKGRKLDMIRSNPNVFFEMECDVQPFEGRVACQYGVAYASLMGRGQAELIEDTQEKKEMMALFMKSLTGKDFVFDDRKVSVVTMIRIRVTRYTAKRRALPAVLQENPTCEKEE